MATPRCHIPLYLLFLAILFEGCGTPSQEKSLAQAPLASPSPENTELVSIDLPDILAQDTLRAILTYSSSSYFIYKGQPMGFEYELVQRLGEHLGVYIKVIVAEDMDAMIPMLTNGEGDLIAHGMTITQARKQQVAFTLPHNQTQQVLVQRKPSDWRNMKLHEIDRDLIRNPIQLIGKTVSVRRGSAYYDRLKNLSEEIGGEIDIHQVSGQFTTDELIEQVAKGKVDLTVADQNIARINRTYFDQIDIETPLSLTQQLAWMVRKSSPELLEAVDSWIREFYKETDFHVIYNKYFQNKRAFVSRMKSEFFSRTGGKLSPYDELLQAHADSIEWDWRLLASMVYQESRFDPKTESWAGAKGLMQVMPTTGKEFGAHNLFNPQENIRAGIAFLQRMQNIWIQKIPNPSERIKFILASYNVGPGHVLDAQRLAVKLGKDPTQWEGNVAECLLLKTQPEYFNDEVVTSGYCRGQEPYHYVQDILGRYEEYKLFL